ncbi:hypothetical protein Hanom_Chr16g01416331 [Helianthus anomalus]
MLYHLKQYVQVVIWFSQFSFRVNFRFAPCGLVTLTVLPQTFKNSHFTPRYFGFVASLLPAGSKTEKQTNWMELEAGSKLAKKPKHQGVKWLFLKVWSKTVKVTKPQGAKRKFTLSFN